MRKLGIMVCFFLFTAIVNGKEPVYQEMIDKANKSYAEEDYNLAISRYDSVLDAGLESYLLYFNLGNSYFKLNNIPAAILYYEKARKLNPTDEDVRFNLDLANSRIIDKIDPLPEFFLKAWWKSARDILTSDQWSFLVVIFFLSGMAFLAFFIISGSVMIRKITFWTGITFLVMVFISLSFAINSYKEYSKHSSAIIFTPTVTVKSSPSEGSVDLFVIHEGTKVFLTDSVEGWSEVRLINGNIGWVRTSLFKPI